MKINEVLLHVNPSEECLAQTKCLISTFILTSIVIEFNNYVYDTRADGKVLKPRTLLGKGSGSLPPSPDPFRWSEIKMSAR